MQFEDRNFETELESVSIIKTLFQAFVLPAGICAAGAVVFLAFSAQAQSLNCEQATKSAEFEICNNEELTLLDEKLAKAFTKKFISQPTLPQQQAVTKAHSEWLQKRDACLNDAKCLSTQYQKRIVALNNDGIVVKSLSAFTSE